MSQGKIHEVVQNFLKEFYDAFQKKDIKRLMKYYESDFQKNSQGFYDKESWPSIANVHYCLHGKKMKGGTDDVFYLFYKELRFRHIYSNRNLSKIITQNFREQSYKNYISIFKVIRESPEKISIPNQWLWDMTDEFIYQFQMYHLVRYEGKKSEDYQQYSKPIILPKVESGPAAPWSIPAVFNMFEENVEASNIEDILLSEMSLTNQKYRTRVILGYFSQIALLRLNCMLGDYYNAIKSINFINLHKSSIFTSIHACNIALYYFASFAFFMLRRYLTCIRLLSSLLLHNERTKRDSMSSSKTSYTWESAIRKRIDQAFNLLAIAINICPTKIDDGVYNLLKARFKDHRSNLGKGKGKGLAKGHLDTFQEVFRFSHPRFFVSMTQSQVELFNREMINQRIKYKNKKFVLKSMSTVSLDRLKKLLPDTMANPEPYLCCLKHKSRQIVFAKNQPPLLDGKPHLQLDTDFCIDDETVVFSVPRPKNESELLIKRICKIQEILKE